MTTTRARDVEDSVRQVETLVGAGASLVRITVPQLDDAKALEEIRAVLERRAVVAEIVADVHFSPDVAIEAACWASKVRINPGNYSDTREVDSEEAYNASLASMRQRLLPLFDACRRHGTALRIGVNHGSLSPRVVHRYGAGSMGMVASALELVEIAQGYGFHDLVVSLKASDPRIMVDANRLLAQLLDDRGWHYPIHLGITEAGAGQDGRVKSAVGIGALLADGIGDTIRVSLTEEPEAELPVCQSIIEQVARWAAASTSPMKVLRSCDSLHPTHREGVTLCDYFAHRALLVLIAEDECAFRTAIEARGGEEPFDLILYGDPSGFDLDEEAKKRVAFLEPGALDTWRVVSNGLRIAQRSVQWVLNASSSDALALGGISLLILRDGSLGPWEVQSAMFHLASLGIRLPVVLRKDVLPSCAEKDYSTIAALELGPLLLDEFIEGIASTVDAVSVPVWREVGFSILQATGLRRTQADYIACPGCGRTLFDLQGALMRVQKATRHLRHLRIGVMGCIVNGPGEMAGADYGYVGAGPGRITLYKGQKPVMHSVPETEALDALVNLIREHGDWLELKA